MTPARGAFAADNIRQNQPVATDDPMKRLAAAVKDRRTQMNLTQEEVAELGGPSIGSMRSIEGAKASDADHYRPRTYGLLDRVLGWQPGTGRAIAEGAAVADAVPDFRTLTEPQRRTKTLELEERLAQLQVDRSGGAAQDAELQELVDQARGLAEAELAVQVLKRNRISLELTGLFRDLSELRDPTGPEVEALDHVMHAVAALRRMPDPPMSSVAPPRVGLGEGSRFEIYMEESGRYRFRLKLANGFVLASDEAFETKQAAKAACAAMLGLPESQVVEV